MASPTLDRGYPDWICARCGNSLSPKKHPHHVCTFHVGDECGWCGSSDVPVTEPRDYGYPKYPQP